MKLNISLPRAWSDLSDNQLHYLYGLLAEALSSAQVKAYCFFRWSKIKIIGPYGDTGWEICHKKIKGVAEIADIADAVSRLDWIDSLPQYPVRIEKIGGATAADPLLRDFQFGKYLYCDNLYQGYLEKQDLNLLMQMAEILYDKEGINLNRAEKISMFYWWASLKAYFTTIFTHFFAPLDTQSVIEGGISLQRTLQKAMNAQIRALTGGDATKHQAVLKLDTWTALWELDAKAQEYEELKKLHKK